MRYTHLIALIDSELALLRQVRELVAPSCTASASTTPRRQSRKKTETPLAVTDTLVAQSARKRRIAPPALTRLPAIVPRERSTFRRRKFAPVATTESALVGEVPVRPIAVSAAQARSDEARGQIATSRPMLAEDAILLDPEQIARKWLQEMKTAAASDIAPDY